MAFDLVAPRETAAKLQRASHRIFFAEIPLTTESRECNTPSAMANQRSPDKTILTVWLPRTLFARLQKAAGQRQETLTQLVTDLITHATENVELTPEDYRRIADETEKAAQRLPAQGTRRKAG